MKTTLIALILWMSTPTGAQNWSTDLQKINAWFGQENLSVSVQVQAESAAGTMDMGTATIRRAGDLYHTRFNETEMLCDGKTLLLIDHDQRQIRWSQGLAAQPGQGAGTPDLDALAREAGKVTHLQDDGALRSYHFQLNGLIQEATLTLNKESGAMISYAYTILDDPTTPASESQRITCRYTEQATRGPKTRLSDVISLKGDQATGLGDYTHFTCIRL